MQYLELHGLRNFQPQDGGENPHHPLYQILLSYHRNDRLLFSRAYRITDIDYRNAHYSFWSYDLARRARLDFDFAGLIGRQMDPESDDRITRMIASTLFYEYNHPRDLEYTLLGYMDPPAAQGIVDFVANQTGYWQLRIPLPHNDTDRLIYEGGHLYRMEPID